VTAINSFCNSRANTIWAYIDSLFNLGWLFIVVSLGLALLTVLVALWKEINTTRQGSPHLTKGSASGFLDSLKGVIEALANAPKWFAIFLAGCALIWLSTTVVANMCEISSQAAPASN
jgi:hypothetical protein